MPGEEQNPEVPGEEQNPEVAFANDASKNGTDMVPGTELTYAEADSTWTTPENTAPDNAYPIDGYTKEDADNMLETVAGEYDSFKASYSNAQDNKLSEIDSEGNGYIVSYDTAGNPTEVQYMKENIKTLKFVYEFSNDGSGTHDGTTMYSSRGWILDGRN